MPTYTYKAKRGPAETVEGELVAETRAAVMAELDARGLSPVHIAEKRAAGEPAPRFWQRVSVRDVTVFTRQLASLTRSGVPILRALTTIAEQTTNVRLRKIVTSLEATIRDGQMLSEALEAHPRHFSRLYIDLVRSGESGGVLDTVLERLAAARENEEDLRRKIQAAAAYPILTVCVGIATIFVLLAFFLPRVVDLFDGYARLPLPTRVLIGASDFFAGHWYWILLLALLGAALVRRILAQEAGRAVLDALALRTPLLGRFLVLVGVARFARTLALLLESGLPIERALQLSEAVLRNSVLRAELVRVREHTIQQGMPFSDGLKRTRFFPAFMANMCAVGEEAGRLDESLTEVANFYEKDVDQQSRMATSLLEPILILVVGAIVGFIVAAMLLPIFELSATR